MSTYKYESIQLVDASGEEFSFTQVNDLRINIESGIIEVLRNNESFVLPFDRLRSFQVHFTTAQEAQAAYRSCEVTLTSLPKDAPNKLTLSEIINFDWKADQGLFMLFAKNSTLGVHLDHLISFKTEK